LLQLLLLLRVFLLKLLELLLLLLLDLLPSSILGTSLLNLLLLLDLLLFDLLTLLVLLLAELLELLLMFLLNLRVHRGRRVRIVWPCISRPVIVGPVSTTVCRRIPGWIALRRLSAGVRRGRPIRIILGVARRLAGVIGRRRPVRIISHIGLRLSRIAGSGRPVRIVLIISLLLPLTVSVVVLLLAGPSISLPTLRCPRRSRRRQLDIRPDLLRVLILLLTHLRDGRRPAAIGLNLLLLSNEGDRSGGRRRLSHDGAFL